MITPNILSPFPVALLLFLISLVIVTATSAWFTRRLEALCELFGLSIGILSLLSAIGANIPNYAASTLAIMSGHIDVGIGIIVGSNIYNIAITLGLCTLALRETSGIALNAQESEDVRGIAWYALALMLSILVVIALLPSAAVTVANRRAGAAHFLLLAALFVVLWIFNARIAHIVRRSHPAPASSLATHSLTHLSPSPPGPVFPSSAWGVSP